MRTYLVNEVFGPSVSGEGVVAGELSAFVRLSACDGDGYTHCQFCDTKYSWNVNDPLYTSEKMTAEEITTKLNDLPWKGQANNPLVTLTGGNPLVQLSATDDELMLSLVKAGYRVHVETQGTIWKEPMLLASSISVSPKPPSSGLSELPISKAAVWANRAGSSQRISYKFVVFDEADFVWVENYIDALKGRISDSTAHISYYLQSGTATTGDPVDAVLTSYRWLVGRWLASPLDDALVLPQLHVLVWGRKTGV